MQWPKEDKMLALRNNRVILTTASAALALVLAGCGTHITTTKNGEKPEKVDIESPFGSLHVRSQVDPKETGLPVYPGSRPKHDQDADSANVNISSSMFGVKVVVAAFQSDDPPEKVADFYSKDIKRFGPVLQCKSSGSQLWHKSDSDELGCEHGAVTDVKAAISSGGLELKSGSKGNQHIVALKPHGSGTEYAIVYVSTHGKGDTI
jgi:hypothetical protein